MIAVLILLLSLCHVISFAQNETGETCNVATPKWVTLKGYWVVETNLKTPRSATLCFYNDDNLLVYKEKMEGVKINVNKRKTKMQLKKILEQSLVLYEQRKCASENELLAKNIISKK